MPKGKNKKFIDKNNSVTFQVVHRSQQDPLAADASAPQHVLVPINSGKVEKYDKDPISIEKRKETQKKYGIFFDDNYDYLQHLKDVNTLPAQWERVEQINKKKDGKDTPKINLPSSVFASDVEEAVGLLNKAAPISGPRLDLDPDIVAAMDDDFEYDDCNNQLEDNFLELANGPIDGSFNEEDEDDYESDISSGNMAYSDEERDEVCSLDGPQYSFREEETKSRFTEYSMSSSVMRRNEQLSLLDDKFEKLFETYDENEIGALDDDDIDGFVAPENSYALKQCLTKLQADDTPDSDNMIELMKERLKIIEEDSKPTQKFEEFWEIPHERDQWDCESILTMNSTLYNHPKCIAEPKGPRKIKVNKRTGVPILEGMPGQLTAKNLAAFDRQNDPIENNICPAQSVAETIKSRMAELAEIRKTGTPEERKVLKKELKTLRRERIQERKANTEAFKIEKKRQEKILLNNKQNIQGKHIF